MVTKSGTSPWGLRVAMLMAGAAILFLGVMIVVALIRTTSDAGGVAVLVLFFVGVVAAVVLPILHARRMIRRSAREAPQAPGGISYDVVLQGRRAFRFRLPGPPHRDGHLVIEDESLVLVLRGRPQRRVQYSDVRSVEAARLWSGGTFHGIALAVGDHTLDLFLFEKRRPATREFRDSVVVQIRNRMGMGSLQD